MDKIISEVQAFKNRESLNQIALSKGMKYLYSSNSDETEASDIANHILEEINKFHNSIDENHEVGINLVNCGQTMQFYVEKIGYIDPILIKFYGYMEDQSPIELIQHISQLNFVMIRLKKLEPEKPKRPIGFVYAEEDQECMNPDTE